MDEPYAAYDIGDNTIYKRQYIEELLEDDELSFEEAAFMTGYCDFT